MIFKHRNWDNLQKKDIDINSSKEAIRYFEKSNESSLRKNIDSSKLIVELEEQKNILINDFQDKYKLSFEDAKNFVDSTENPERYYNMEEYNEIVSLNDRIDGEKFYIYQRNRLINKNKEIIRDINKWIDKIEGN